MLVAQIIKLDTKAIDFFIEFPRFYLDVPAYLELPAGMDFAGHGKDSSKYLLKLNKYLYGLKKRISQLA